MAKIRFYESKFKLPLLPGQCFESDQPVAGPQKKWFPFNPMPCTDDAGPSGLELAVLFSPFNLCHGLRTGRSQILEWLSSTVQE